MADPNFNVTGRIDLLLGIDVFTRILLTGRHEGSPGSPVALETLIGWVLCGDVQSSNSYSSAVTVCHTLIDMSDDTLRRFWEIEEPPNRKNGQHSQKERSAVQQFKGHYTRLKDGQFVVPLPRDSNDLKIVESRSQAVRRFISLERRKNRFSELDDVIGEYFDLQHAEPVPSGDLYKPPDEVFYLPIHAVYKRSSSTTKVRAVFDASAKSESGVSFNETLLSGPTIHSPLIDVLLRFRLHRVAITADVSKMYGAVHLASEDKEFHRFVWRSTPTDPLRDFRMTRVTFGVSASSFAANMAIKQNALDFEYKFPLASKVVEENIYVDDCHAKTLGLEWNTTHDFFRLTISDMQTPDILTKRILVSNVAKLFDVLGWFSPTVIKMKVLLQQLWEAKLDWDDPVPDIVRRVCIKWNTKLQLLSSCHIPRYLFPKNFTAHNIQ